VGKEKKKTGKRNRRCGFARRSYTYSHFIPERRSGKDRRDTTETDTDLTDPTLLEQDKKPAPKDMPTSGKHSGSAE
jgi:hypothetical protein